MIELHADGTYEGFHGAIGEVGDWRWDPVGQAVELQAHRGRVLWLDVSQSDLVNPDRSGSTIRLRDDDQGRSMYLTEDDLTGVMDLAVLEQLFAEERMHPLRRDADFRVMAFPTRTLTFKQAPMTKRGFDIEMREENHFVAMQDRRRLDDWVLDQEGNAQLGEFMRCYVTEPSLGSIPGGFDASGCSFAVTGSERSMEVVEISERGGLTRELAIGSWVFDGWLPSAVSDQYCDSTTYGITQSCTTELHVNEDGTVVLETWDRNRDRHTQSGMWALSSGGSLIISRDESSDIVELKLIDQNTDGSFMISVEGASEHSLGYTDTYLNLNKFSRLEHAVKRAPQDLNYLVNDGHLDVPLVSFAYWQNPERYRREDGTPAEGISYTLHSEGNALSRNLHYESSVTSEPYFRSYSGGFESADNYLRLEYCRSSDQDYSKLGENGDPCGGDERRRLREFEVIYAADIDGDDRFDRFYVRVTTGYLYRDDSRWWRDSWRQYLQEEFGVQEPDGSFYPLLDYGDSSFYFYQGHPDLLFADVDADGVEWPGEDIDLDGKLDTAEDLDGDGRLDTNEDIDGDGRLDSNEDIDGDGRLDVDEDANGNGILDEGEDADGDGYANPFVYKSICYDADGDGLPDEAPIEGWKCDLGDPSTLEFDCDDTDDTIHPGVDEVCGDNADNDCNGSSDEDCGD